MTQAPFEHFLEDVSHERYVLARVAPLLLSMTETQSVLNLETNHMTVSMSATATIGMNLDQAVEKLGIRPLAFAAAWKVIDLLLEAAYENDAMAPKDKKRWSIKEKVGHAKAGAGRVPFLSEHSELWSRLTTAYANTEQVRHALTHRRANFDAEGALWSTLPDGSVGPHITRDEQIAFMRAAQRISDIIEAVEDDRRTRDALLADLDQLHRLTGLIDLRLLPVVHPPAQYRIEARSGQEVDLTWLKDRLRRQSPQQSHFDLTFDLSTATIEVELEDLPDGVVTLSVGREWLEG